MITTTAKLSDCGLFRYGWILPIGYTFKNLKAYLPSTVRETTLCEPTFSTVIYPQLRRGSTKVLLSAMYLACSVYSPLTWQNTCKYNSLHQVFGLKSSLPSFSFWTREESLFGMGIFFCNQLIIFCCSNKRAMIKGSVGKGLPLAFIATEYLWHFSNISRNSFLSSSDFRPSANAFHDSISLWVSFPQGIGSYV